MRGIGIEHRQPQDDERAGQDEQQAGRQSAPKAVELPADPYGELLRLGSGKQVAEIQGVKILVFAHPSTLIDEFAMHQRDLPGRPPEAQEPYPRADTQQLGKIRFVR